MLEQSAELKLPKTIITNPIETSASPIPVPGPKKRVSPPSSPQRKISPKHQHLLALSLEDNSQKLIRLAFWAVEKGDTKILSAIIDPVTPAQEAEQVRLERECDEAWNQLLENSFIENNYSLYKFMAELLQGAQSEYSAQRQGVSIPYTYASLQPFFQAAQVASLKSFIDEPSIPESADIELFLKHKALGKLNNVYKNRIQLRLEEQIVPATKFSVTEFIKVKLAAGKSYHWDEKLRRYFKFPEEAESFKDMWRKRLNGQLKIICYPNNQMMANNASAHHTASLRQFQVSKAKKSEVDALLNDLQSKVSVAGRQRKDLFRLVLARLRMEGFPEGCHLELAGAEVGDEFLNLKVSANATNNVSTTLTQHAVRYEQVEVLGLLANCGADVFAIDSNGRSAFFEALQLATEHGKTKCIKSLIEKIKPCSVATIAGIDMRLLNDPDMQKHIETLNQLKQILDQYIEYLIDRKDTPPGVLERFFKKGSKLSTRSLQLEAIYQALIKFASLDIAVLTIKDFITNIGKNASGSSLFEQLEKFWKTHTVDSSKIDSLRDRIHNLEMSVLHEYQERLIVLEEKIAVLAEQAQHLQEEKKMLFVESQEKITVLEGKVAVLEVQDDKKIILGLQEKNNALQEELETLLEEKNVAEAKIDRLTAALVGCEDQIVDLKKEQAENRETLKIQGEELKDVMKELGLRRRERKPQSSSNSSPMPSSSVNSNEVILPSQHATQVSLHAVGFFAPASAQLSQPKQAEMPGNTDGQDSDDFKAGSGCN